MQATEVTIRLAFPDDERAVRRLAALDSQATPTGTLLVAEVDGELWAAVQVAGTAVVADPFRRTADLVELLRARAAQLSRSAVARPAGSFDRSQAGSADRGWRGRVFSAS